jgi:phospholipid/cholesterol/gamma-HCH transport system permease protein
VRREGGEISALPRRAFLPARHLLEELGDMMLLTGRTIYSTVRPPYVYGGELFGALDFLGGFFVIEVVREIGPLITAIVVAGVGGTAITADLGARKVREELDALQVLGVDPVKSLVVPRFLSLMIVTGLFNVYSILFGLYGGLLAEIENGGSLGPFWHTLFANATVTDLWGSVLKTTVFGAIIAIVSCYKGMTASGGAEGVGRAVNEAVVVSFLVLGAFNYVFTQTLLATHPQILVLK